MARLRRPPTFPATAPLALFLLGALFAVVRCGEPERPEVVAPRAPARPQFEPPPPPALPSPTFCGLDFPCPGGAPCLSGRCGGEPGTDRGRCKEDRGCGPGARCDEGRCLDGARDCAVDGDCGPGNRCAAGSCTAGERDCTGPSDCRSLCHLGRCASRVDAGPGDSGQGEGGLCDRDLDCPDGRCEAGRCLSGLRRCRAARDCPPGLTCSEGLCARPAVP